MSLSALLRPRLCELGKLKIGGRAAKVRTTAAGGTWRAPEKYDHWVITTMHRNTAGDLVPDGALMEALAVKFADADGLLRQIPITLLSDDPDDIMQSSWVWYGGKKVAARSDGETVTWFADPKTMKLRAEPLTEPWQDEYAQLKDPKGNALFKLHTVFCCVVASGESRWGGVYKFRTTSRITADQLYGSLLHLRALTSGILRGLPLMLVVRPMEVAPDGKPTTVYVVHVELRGADLQAVQQIALQQQQYQLVNFKRMQAMQIEYRKLLQAPGENETPEEVAEVQEEFHPPVNGNDDVIPPAGADPVAEQLGLGNGEPLAPIAPTARDRMASLLDTDVGRDAFAELFGDALLPEELTDDQVAELLAAIDARDQGEAERGTHGRTELFD